MNAILGLPMPLRLAGLALVGLMLGGLANWAIYALAWHSRPISPWQNPDAKAPPRQWGDYIPFFGWLGLARESVVHGSGFWVRPLLIDLASAVGVPALYWWEVTGHLAPDVADPFGGIIVAPPAMLHLEFLSHAILIGLMLVATFIDFDEQTIPDAITLPGTLLGLVLIAAAPDALLPVFLPPALKYDVLLCTSPGAWPLWLDSWPGLLLGSGIFTGWCLVMIPALATLRRGWMKAVQFYFASMAREHAWWQMLLLAMFGSAGIAGVWRIGGTHWQGLLTALVGLAGGGLLVWGVRIVGWVGLRKEAMGFGDVTFMAMIGVYLGWQPCLLIFFLSPVAALVVSVSQWVLTGRRDIAFGPYLALAAVYVILDWNRVWSIAMFWFATGGLVPAFMAAGLLLMMGLLMLWRITEQAFFGRS